MTNDAASNRLPKLKGRENYKIWASQIQTYIDGVGSWEIVLGTEDPPDPPDDLIPSDVDSLHEEAPPSEASVRQHKRDLRQYKEDLREYKSRAAKAKSAIEVNCIESIQQLLTDYPDASSMWQYLQSQYASSGPAERMDVFSRWKHMEFDGKDVAHFAQEYQASLRKIDNYGIVLGLEARVYCFIDLVAPYYKTWATIKEDSLKKITGITDTAAADHLLPKISDLVSDLLDHDAQNKRQDHVSMSMRPKPQSRQNPGQNHHSKPKPNPHKNRTCSYCNKEGHIDSICFAKHGWPKGHPNHGKPLPTLKPKDEANQQKPSMAQTFMARHTTRHTTTQPGGMWLWDSGAHCHCTNSLIGFTNRVPVDSGVIVGDNRPLRGLYLGDVLLPCLAPDGSITPVTFTNVLYVPELATNLISERVMR